MLSNFYQISEVELQTVDGGGWVAVAVSAVVTAAGIVAAVATAGVSVPVIAAVATIVSITGGTASTVYTTYEAITGN